MARNRKREATLASENSLEAELLLLEEVLLLRVMLKMKVQACQAAAMAILTNGPHLTPGPRKYGNWIK